MRALRIGVVGAAVLAIGAAGCGGGRTPDAGGGTGSATIAGAMFDVSNMTFAFTPGEDGAFRIEADDAKHPDEDCLPGLGGGLALYGDLPSDVRVVQQLAGRDLPIEFTGDGDDFNLCFVGSNGLLGVEQGTVHITAVNGANVAFTFSGRFVVYDGAGGQSPLPVEASGRGVARVKLD